MNPDNYPESPGVYLMKNEKGVILYIGKAKKLKTRLKQYFSGADTRVQIPYLLENITDIETILTTSEKDALFLEATLIKRFKPKYNILLKDDKSRLYLRLDCQHKWPRLEFVRSHETEKGACLFGPYSTTSLAREAFDLVVRLFKIRHCSNSEFCRRSAPCLWYQLHKCSAPCVGYVSQDEYGEQIEKAFAFLSGNVASLKEKLSEEMKRASERLEFEHAGSLYHSIQVLDALNMGEKRKKRHDIDVIGSWFEGSKCALSILHYRKGELIYGESWAFSSVEGICHKEALEQLIVQYYMLFFDEGRPKEIILPPGEWSEHSLSACLQEQFGRKVRVHKAARYNEMVALAIENARAKISQEESFDERMRFMLETLFSKLKLSVFPNSIDCFDASHFGGTGQVAASVRFEKGVKKKEKYRSFHIQGTQVADDEAMLYEAIVRRYKGGGFPDLILVDGGKGQFRAASRALETLSQTVDLVAICKEKGKHTRGMTKERLYIQGSSEPILLPNNSSELLFLQSVRDEAHRFVLYHQKKKRTSFSSCLETIPGIGKKKTKKLLMAFSGIKALRKAESEEIEKKAGLSSRDSDAVHAFLMTHLD